MEIFGGIHFELPLGTRFGVSYSHNYILFAFCLPEYVR
jgi:hypothetical protein